MTTNHGSAGPTPDERPDEHMSDGESASSEAVNISMENADDEEETSDCIEAQNVVLAGRPKGLVRASTSGPTGSASMKSASAAQNRKSLADYPKRVTSYSTNHPNLEIGATAMSANMSGGPPVRENTEEVFESLTNTSFLLDSQNETECDSVEHPELDGKGGPLEAANASGQAAAQAYEIELQIAKEKLLKQKDVGAGKHPGLPSAPSPKSKGVALNRPLPAPPTHNPVNHPKGVPKQHSSKSKSHSTVGALAAYGTSLIYGSQEERDRKAYQKEIDKRVQEETRRLNDDHVNTWKSWQASFERQDIVVRDQNLRIQELEADRNELRRKNAELHESLQGQESLVLDAQSKALQMLDKAEWTPQEDAKTRQELNGLEKAIRNWCKAYALESFSEWRLHTMTQKELDSLRYDWEAFAMLPVEGFTPVGFEEKSMSNKAWMFLAAWVTSYVYSKIFRDPFFFLEEFMEELDHEQDPKGRSTRTASCGADRDMRYMLRKLEACHGLRSKEVQHFRSQYLRLLDPPPSVGMTSAMMDIKDTTKAARSHFAREATAIFLQKSERFLKKGDAGKIGSALGEIMVTATSLSFRLWTQRSYLTREGHKLRGKIFSSTDKKLTPSNLHTGLLSDDENALEGKTILMVFHPAIIAYGDSEGNDYSITRILKKAVVLVQTRGD